MRRTSREGENFGEAANSHSPLSMQETSGFDQSLRETTMTFVCENKKKKEENEEEKRKNEQVRVGK